MSVLVTRAPVGVFEHLKMWFEMTRPRVLLLVLFTGLPVLGMTKGGWPTISEAFWVLVGTALAGAASSTFNAWIERDSDARMARTRNRPLPATALAPGQALLLGWVLTVLSTGVLAWIGGWLAAVVGIATILFYVFVYTIWLKPRTPQNIVIGGAAGATAPMIAEAALTGGVSVVSILLFLMIVLWTPPHFWAIAIFRKEEYEAAGFPMMPSVIGVAATRRQSLVYTVLLVLCTLVPSFIGLLGPLYGVTALAAGLWFGRVVVESIAKDDIAVDYRVFKVSISYLFIVFGMMLAECVLRALLPGQVLWEPIPSLWTSAVS